MCHISYTVCHISHIIHRISSIQNFGFLRYNSVHHSTGTPRIGCAFSTVKPTSRATPQLGPCGASRRPSRSSASREPPMEELGPAYGCWKGVGVGGFEIVWTWTCFFSRTVSYMKPMMVKSDVSLFKHDILESAPVFFETFCWVKACEPNRPLALNDSDYSVNDGKLINSIR